MSWITVLLIGWPVTSLVCGPVIGRFVGVRMNNPLEPSEEAVPPPEAPAKPAGFAESALTLKL